MSETHHEDRTIVALLEALEAGTETGLPADAANAGAANAGAANAGAATAGDEAGEALARLYTEVAGLLPYALDPVAPPPGLRERILAQAMGDATEDAVGDDTQDFGGVAPVAAPARPARVVTAVRPAEAGSASASSAAGPMAPVRSRASRWPLALAASLALLLLGTSAFLYIQLLNQGVTIDRLSGELRLEQERYAKLVGERALIETQLAELKNHFGLVTSPAVEVSPMRPDVASPQPQASGVLYVAADHQHWYLSVHNLEPLGPGGRYHLWFKTPTGAVNGGTFDAQPGAPANLSSEHMPPDTVAVLITLEPGTEAAAPNGPEVLRATGKVIL